MPNSKIKRSFLIVKGLKLKEQTTLDIQTKKNLGT